VGCDGGFPSPSVGSLRQESPSTPYHCGSPLFIQLPCCPHWDRRRHLARRETTTSGVPWFQTPGFVLGRLLNRYKTAGEAAVIATFEQSHIRFGHSSRSHWPRTSLPSLGRWPLFPLTLRLIPTGGRPRFGASRRCTGGSPDQLFESRAKIKKKPRGAGGFFFFFFFKNSSPLDLVEPHHTPRRGPWTLHSFDLNAGFNKSRNRERRPCCAYSVVSSDELMQVGNAVRASHGRRNGISQGTAPSRRVPGPRSSPESGFGARRRDRNRPTAGWFRQRRMGDMKPPFVRHRDVPPSSAPYRILTHQVPNPSTAFSASALTSSAPPVVPIDRFNIATLEVRFAVQNADRQMGASRLHDSIWGGGFVSNKTPR